MTTADPTLQTDPTLLSRWFAIMDSSDADRVLDLVADDFQMSVVFSTGADGTVADFSGDRSALVHYLEQREVGTRVHVVLDAVRRGDVEHVLGEVQRAGAFEASFLAAGQVDHSGTRLRRLLIGRSPGARFTG